MHIVLIVIVSVILGVTPLPTIQQPPNLAMDANPSSSVIQSSKTEDKQTKPAEVKPEEAKPTVEKVQTWQDNPQNCNQETQFISQDAPYNCLDKPIAPPPAPAPTGVTSGNCRQWLIDAGVTDMVNAVELQSRENGSCNPQQYNMGGSDACGVAQELPCGKSGCGMPPNADGACQIRWMNSYVLGRYGSWAAAVQFHNAHNWY